MEANELVQWGLVAIIVIIAAIVLIHKLKKNDSCSCCPLADECKKKIKNGKECP